MDRASEKSDLTRSVGCPPSEKPPRDPNSIEGRDYQEPAPLVQSRKVNLKAVAADPYVDRPSGITPVVELRRDKSGLTKRRFKLPSQTSASRIGVFGVLRHGGRKRGVWCDGSQVGRHSDYGWFGGRGNSHHGAYVPVMSCPAALISLSVANRITASLRPNSRSPLVGLPSTSFAFAQAHSQDGQ